MKIEERSRARRRPPTERLLRAALGPLALVALGAMVAAYAAPDEPEQRRRRRDRGAQYERTIEALGLQPGDFVAEIGAGDGRFSLRFAEAVGSDGRVYANELDDDDVRRIRRRAEQDGIENLVAVQGAVDDTNLEEACCDAMMMRMVYHMLTDPEPMSRSFYRALKPGGRLLILDGDPQPGEPDADGVPENRAGMGIDPQIVIDELTAVGFVFEEHFESFPGVDYAILFTRGARASDDR